MGGNIKTVTTSSLALSRNQAAPCHQPSIVDAPFWKSEEFSFTLTGYSGPTSLRTARTTSRRKRARFARLPPQRSVRRLTSGDKNWLHKYP